MIEEIQEWRHPWCKRESDHKCINHNWFVCNIHLTRYHSKCETKPLRQVFECKQNLDVIEQLINQIEHHFMVYNTEELYPGSFKDLWELRNAHSILFDKYKDAGNSQYKKTKIMEEALKLMNKLNASKAKASYCNHLIHMIGENLVNRDNFDFLEREQLNETIKTMQIEIITLKSAINSAEEQNSKLIEEWKTMTAHYQETEPIDHQMLSDIISIEREMTEVLDSNSELHLSLTYLKEKELLVLLMNTKLPKLETIHVDLIDDDNTSDCVVRLLSYSLPTPLPNLYLNLNRDSEYMLLGFKYTNALKVALPKVTDEIAVNYIDLDTGTLETLFKYSYKCESLWIQNAKLPKKGSYNFEAAKGEHKINFLSFKFCGMSHSNNWKQNFDRFSAIVQAIGACSLAKSLKKIDVSYCKLNTEMVTECFEENGMYIQVINGFEETSKEKSESEDSESESLEDKKPASKGSESEDSNSEESY